MRRTHIAIFLLSLLTLLFQFAQTRLFSATLDHHLTFLVLSGALLGVGAGGTLSAVFDQRRRRPGSALLAACAAVATIVGLAVETRIDPMEGTIAAIVTGYLLSIVPALFVSWVIVRALREASQSASGSLYAADLAGAATGAIVGYLAIGTLGAQGLYGVAAAAALAAAALLSRARGSASLMLRAALALCALILIAALSMFGETLARPLPGPLKALDIGRTHELGRWDPLARIDISRQGAEGDASHYAFLISERYENARPPSLVMTLDMGALTPIVRANASDDLGVLEASILAAPYDLSPRRTALIVGPGGGIDVLVALRHGVTSVTAVEVNRTEVALMRGPYAEYSGNLYLNPRVHVFEDEARSFIRRSSERFDVIAITVVDSFAALSAGAYALTENYLYTEEAMRDFLTHLAPSGVVAMSRWYRDPPDEIVRVLSVAESALRTLGRSDPARSIAILRHGNFGLMLFRVEPFTDAEVGRLRTFAKVQGFVLALDPHAPAGPLHSAPRGAPPTDDRPFFFDTVPLGDVLRGRAPLPYGYGVLIATLALSSALALGGVLLPLYRGARSVSGRTIPTGTVSAFFVGLGFIGAEIVVLQRLTLYLGQPSLALSIGLAALLAGAASGSALSARFPGGGAAAALSSAGGLLAILTVLPLVTDVTLAAPLTVRITIGALSAGLIGLPLGTVFPRILTSVRSVHSGLVSWAWAVNGTASVIGAIASTAVALLWGFGILGVVATACYLVVAMASVTPWRGERSSQRAGVLDRPPSAM